jgi:hypothetical protein
MTRTKMTMMYSCRSQEMGCDDTEVVSQDR